MAGSESAARFLRTGLRLFRAEFPDRAARLGALLETIPGVYDIGRERLSVTAAGGRTSVKKAGPAQRLRVEASLEPEAILAVVDGTATMQEVLAEERFVVAADAEALLTLSEAVQLVAESAIRSSVLQNHFESYREWVLKGRG